MDFEQGTHLSVMSTRPRSRGGGGPQSQCPPAASPCPPALGNVDVVHHVALAGPSGAADRGHDAGDGVQVLGVDLLDGYSLLLYNR